MDGRTDRQMNEQIDNMYKIKEKRWLEVRIVLLYVYTIYSMDLDLKR